MPQTLELLLSDKRVKIAEARGTHGLTASRRIDHDLLTHLSPTLLDHITRFDTHTFDVEAESERTGYRRLRVPAAE